MPSAPLPANERERLLDLESYAILDTPDERAFDEIVETASMIFDMPIALVSLIDAHRQWWKARVGVSGHETPREDAFCAHTLDSSQVMVIEDAREDPRFRDNVLVTQDPRIRFYAGAPLVSDRGHNLGALCVIDMAPRKFSEREQRILQRLAHRVMSEMELRRAARRPCPLPLVPNTANPMGCPSAAPSAFALPVPH